MNTCTIKRTSMYPTLIEGDRIIFHKKKEYTPGDILVYKTKKKLIAHRLIAMKEDYLILKGDNNHKSEKIKPKQVMGAIMFINNKRFKNSLMQKAVAKLSKNQEKIVRKEISCSWKRKAVKVLSNPVLYVVNIKKIFSRKTSSS